MKPPKKTAARIGRPPIPDEERRAAILRVRVTEAEAEKYEAVGGATWFRASLKRARVTQAK